MSSCIERTQQPNPAVSSIRSKTSRSGTRRARGFSAGRGPGRHALPRFPVGPQLALHRAGDAQPEERQGVMVAPQSRGQTAPRVDRISTAFSYTGTCSLLGYPRRSPASSGKFIRNVRPSRVALLRRRRRPGLPADPGRPSGPAGPRRAPHRAALASPSSSRIRPGRLPALRPTLLVRHPAYLGSSAAPAFSWHFVLVFTGLGP